VKILLRSLVFRALYLIIPNLVVGATGVLMADSLSIRPMTALIFPISVSAVAIATAQMGRSIESYKELVDAIFTLASAALFVLGIGALLFLGVAMLIATGSFAVIVYFTMIFAEWIFFYVMW
jgi:hypothetical protein